MIHVLQAGALWSAKYAQESPCDTCSAGWRAMVDKVTQEGPTIHALWADAPCAAKFEIRRK